MKYKIALVAACAFVSLGTASLADEYQPTPDSSEGQFIDGMSMLNDDVFPDYESEAPAHHDLFPDFEDGAPPQASFHNEAPAPAPSLSPELAPSPSFQNYSHEMDHTALERHNDFSPAIASAIKTIPGMPPVINPNDLYSETEGVDKLSPVVKNHLVRVYVPNLRSNTVSVIDPKLMKVVGTLKVGHSPQHVVPSWDLRTLWVTNNSERRTDGSLTPIDPVTGKTGQSVAVDDPYNLYFTPDGKTAIVVAEARQRLDFRDPKTMQPIEKLDIPACKGINHAAFAIDGRYAIFTCEFGPYLAKVDTVNRKLVGILHLSKGGMPQDILTSRNGRKFYVADMMADGVFIIDGDNFKEVGFIHSGPGTHGLYPSRDGKLIYATNRGSHAIHGRRHSPGGSISVISADTEQVIKHWPVPGGGSPDMGNVSADGKTLWISGRFDDCVYAINTEDGSMRKIGVGMEPHGLTVWPQPGRYSVGHTGIMR